LRLEAGLLELSNRKELEQICLFESEVEPAATSKGPD
jgi:hypothetical protein